MHYKSPSSGQRLSDALHSKAEPVDLQASWTAGGEKQLSQHGHTKTHFQAVVALVHKASKTLVRRDSATPIHPLVVDDDDEDSLERAEGGQGPQPEHIPRPGAGTIPRQEQRNELGTIAKDRSKGRNAWSSLLRGGSLPPLPRLGNANISPLKDKKGQAARLKIAQREGGSEEGQPTTQLKPQSIMKEVNKGKRKLPDSKKTLTFQLPFLSRRETVRTPRVECLNETELMGRDILKQCNVFPNSTRRGDDSQLHQGEGHTVSGFGMTNKQVYYKVFGSYK